MGDDDVELRPWRPRPGPYLGEISALSLLPLRPNLSPSFPLLLAGTGSQLLVYAVESGRLLNSFQVFDGVRVHGIAPRSPRSTELPFSVAVFGERRVGLFALGVGVGVGGAVASVALELVRRLPGFDQWVLDVHFLEEDELLAVGLSDNSVALWDLKACSQVSRVKSPERCLLFSMRMCGNSIGSLLVASGTIFNEILIWKLIPQVLLSSSTSVVETGNPSIACNKNIHSHHQEYFAIHLSRLIGHEGSIFRIAWSTDGSKLMSVSDDRCARIWTLSGGTQDCSQLEQIPGIHVVTQLALFGHNARIWDCYISDSTVITAGEDCTCRVWGMEGKQIMMFKEHIGRGIWRCSYDPCSSLLITAGFDSAIKVHQLRSSSSKEKAENNVMPNEFGSHPEIFTISPPHVSKQLTDSKTEYVRAIHFTREDTLFVATNNGHLYHCNFSSSSDVRWTQLVQVNEEAPIICMDIIAMNSSSFWHMEDVIALGDGKGKVTILSLTNGGSTPKINMCFTWPAEKERQLLGVFWCKSLGCSHLFTADPRGVLKLWSLRDALQSDAYATNRIPVVPLIAMFESCFGARIMCVDASAKEEVMICGDKRGNITIFPLMEGLISSDRCELLEKISPLDSFKGAHGISGVISVCVGVSNYSHVEIRTTGGDGCICFFKYDKDVQKVEFVGMKQVKELSTIQSVLPISASAEYLALGNYAIGFTSTDFIMWDLKNETKMVQIPCGGWRRPYSYYLGIVPEYQHCFAYLKDHTVHIQRLWMPIQERKMFPQILHLQFHGREIHSLCFISVKCELNLKESPYLWIATGCEDGTVRLTRYSSEGWIQSKLLGEHVGGSAVRSLCFIPKIYAFKDQSNHSHDKYTNPLLDSKDNHFILISVGSKQVLTSWILRNISSDYGSGNTSSSISFQWLSTYMPPKSSNKWKIEKLKTEISEKRKSLTSAQTSKALPADRGEEKVSSTIMDQIENDWRYLAVTAFVLKHNDTRLTICFVVVSCSDATLILRALLLPYRLWFDVALLVPQKSPVLALQHIVVPGHSCCKDEISVGNTYMVISGSTDGSLTFWDLTETVENFMQAVLEIRPEMMIDYQRRPRTGRGSQGGRWWRSLPNLSSEKRALDTSSQKNNIVLDNSRETDEAVCEDSSVEESASGSKQERLTRSLAPDLVEVKPLYVLNSVHQSGVNCLHVSEMNDVVHSEPEKTENAYCVVSGGDDQALNCFWFTIEVGVVKSNSNQIEPDDITSSFQDKAAPSIVKCPLLGSSSYCMLRILHQDKIASAHSSAVKGIWTDGRWAFSTGLDQRVRCWQIDQFHKLKEHAHLIISVPEPETLDALICDSTRSKYQIAVAGRGMQMVEFSAS